MIDLNKTYSDHVLAARAVVRAVVNKISAQLELGSQAGEDQALAMEPELNAAEQHADNLQRLYNKMLRAADVANKVKGFMPADGAAPGTMKRSAFNALSSTDQMKFIKRGGKVRD